jgi:hypothetical protein
LKVIVAFVVVVAARIATYLCSNVKMRVKEKLHSFSCLIVLITEGEEEKEEEEEEGGGETNCISGAKSSLARLMKNVNYSHFVAKRERCVHIVV